LRDWKEKKKGKYSETISDSDVAAVLELLQAIGYELFAKGYEQFSESLLRKKMQPWLEPSSPIPEFRGKTPDWVIKKIKRDGVFIKTGAYKDAPLLFLHRTFHEYLTAGALAQQADSQGWEAGDCHPHRQKGLAPRVAGGNCSLGRPAEQSYPATATPGR
jgi:predicted NACHT family NTPase